MGRATVTSIAQASARDADLLAPLVMQYLAFYDRYPDPLAVRDYLHERLLAEECVVFLATKGALDPQPIGFALLYPSFSSLGLRRSLILNDLYVTAEYRRTGIARRLLHAAHHHAALTGAVSIQLETEESNSGARRLYESEGYRQDERFLRYALTIPPATAGGFANPPGHHGVD
jgi:GNAT superfamily N-acetyltransferase